VGKAALLLVLQSQWQPHCDTTRLNTGQVGPDEVHEVLALQLAPDANFEVGRSRIGHE
jgi:hypothetical protein